MAVEIAYSPKLLKEFADAIDGIDTPCPRCSNPLVELDKTKVREFETEDGGIEDRAVRVKVICCRTCLDEVKAKVERTKESNVYINVRHSDRERVKKLGALFDGDVKLWYFNMDAAAEFGRKVNEAELRRLYKIVKVDRKQFTA